MADGILGSVLVARHGETVSNLARRYAGWSDEPLTARGRAQALALARGLKGIDVARVRTSTIARAQETADLVSAVLSVPVVPDERLNELRMGPWHGLTEVEVARQFPEEHEIWMKRPDELRLPGRESLGELAARLHPVLVDSVLSGERELLVTHVALVRLARLMAECRPFAEYKRVEVPNCYVAELPVRRANGYWKPAAHILGEVRLSRAVGE